MNRYIVVWQDFDDACTYLMPTEATDLNGAKRNWMTDLTDGKPDDFDEESYECELEYIIDCKLGIWFETGAGWEQTSQVDQKEKGGAG